MGGDHKCPVCQATFTRPQHVARHMRSHTGDRPYKCQYCGDQFARSDLLSRHINKCHANEKPIPSTGSRRKGAASASRATTSKQACDQCVQSSLPCDGCNPCAKCVQRKCRCTFVKFHRQTAPAGPGHNPRPAASSSRLPMYPPTDDFILGPAPSAVPTMAETLYASQTFAFPPLYPNASDSPSSSSLGLSSEQAEYAARYRVNADLLRAAALGGGSLGHGAPSTGLTPGLYADPRSASGTSWIGGGWSQDPDHFPSVSSLHDKDLQADVANHFMNPHGLGLPAGFPASYLNDRQRRSSLDFSGSDGSTTSHSIPSSAASSTVHLPLDTLPQQHPMSYNPINELSDQGTYAGMASHSDHISRSSNHQQRGSHGGEGGFSSAFGLMSLDDPNVLAGLSSDSAPFFSNTALNLSRHADPNATPMPIKQDEGQGQDGHHDSASQRQHQHQHQQRNTLPTPSREADTRELREFWKQYMRTPLSGPGPSPLDPGSSRPGTTPGYRRPRVASLPSAKTPVLETDKFIQAQPGPADADNATSSMRTTLHGNAEDLRSYEAAVLARKAPTTLNIQPRALKGRKSVAGSAGTSPQVSSIGQPPSFKLNFPQHLSRPGSAPDSSSAPSVSSLANAFGRPQQQQAGSKQGGGGASGPHVSFRENPGTVHDGGSAPSSREASLGLDEASGSGGSGGSDKESLRPSFKRLPSQTLGPANSKRTFLGYDHDDDDDDDDEEDGFGMNHRMTAPVAAQNGSSPMDSQNATSNKPNGLSYPNRIMSGSLAERRRRTSAPTSTSPTAPTFGFAPTGQGAT